MSAVCTVYYYSISMYRWYCFQFSCMDCILHIYLQVVLYKSVLRGLYCVLYYVSVFRYYNVFVEVCTVLCINVQVCTVYCNI